MMKLSQIFIINEKMLQEEQMKNTLKIMLNMLNVRFCFEKGKEGKQSVLRNIIIMLPLFSSAVLR